MSGTVRAGLVFGLAAVGAFIGGMLLPIQCVNVLLAFASVIALGWGAGYTAAKTSGAARGQGLGRGVTAGAIAGLIALVGTLIALIVLGNVLSSRPEFQTMLRQQIEMMQRQNPEIGDIDVGAMAGLAFAIAGFGCGLINFILLLLGGAIGGATWRGAPQAAYAGPQAEPSAQPGAGSAVLPPEPPGGRATPTEPGGERSSDPNDPYQPR